jgi:hypothetical protein
MLAGLRTAVAALLAIATLTTGVTPALAEGAPTVGTACARPGHAHETALATSSGLRAGGGGCGQCERGCTGPGQCVTPASLALPEAAPSAASQQPLRAGYDVATDPLRSTSATPPIPPPQPDL